MTTYRRADTVEDAMTWTLPKKSVLVPWDFSKASCEALQAALSLVLHPRDVTVVHVVEPVSPIATMGEERNREARENLEETLSKVRESVATLGHDQVAVAVRFGVVHEEIAEYAVERGFELIVMPSHRRTGVKRLLLGSVAEQVLRNVPVPVLMLRAHEDED